MLSPIRWILLFVLLIAGCGAQTAPETRYTFHIVDQQNRPIQAATVPLRWVDQEPRLASTDTTDSTGTVTARVMMAGAPPGWSKDLIVSVGTTDFDSATQTTIQDTQTLTVTMRDRIHLEQTIQITRRQP